CQNTPCAQSSNSLLQVKTGEGSTKDLPKAMLAACQTASQSKAAASFLPMRFSPVFSFMFRI
ncbi:MAG: hypothetical protein IJQ41_06350, partial [Firmicutes bacterium]|nr:hypothetical protein [Bacillota bacterium]